MPYFHAFLEVQPHGTLQETAMALGRALGGLEFEEDSSGNFEEYPAYVARDNELSYALLGIPEPKYDIREIKRDTFSLQVESIDYSDSSTVDISEDLLRRISEHSDLICWT